VSDITDITFVFSVVFYHILAVITRPPDGVLLAPSALASLGDG